MITKQHFPFINSPYVRQGLGLMNKEKHKAKCNTFNNYIHILTFENVVNIGPM